MRIVVDVPTDSTDGPWGKLADVVIDPVRRRVTHVVVQPPHRHDEARLIPIEAVESCGDRLELSWPAARIEAAPRVEQSDYHELGEWPELADGWGIGVRRVWAQPYYPLMGVGYGLGSEMMPMLDSTSPITETFDRIPAGTRSARRQPPVREPDGGANSAGLQHASGRLRSKPQRIGNRDACSGGRG